ncbi:glycoside hydrolase family protein [Paenibacillus sp. LjRoot56]|uniref:glycoside hydrolase family protein n=1 Tax=Paenibacillus sp. LjRoot56 TaxID=3342333 RepID=UPI003ECDB06F
MNFQEMLRPVPAGAKFELDGWHVWCGSMTQDAEGRYYLYYSRWPERAGFEAWVTHSEIAYAVADHPLGPFHHVDTAWTCRDSAVSWDRDVAHNPAILRHGNRYYLYYMGTHGPEFDLDRPADEATWWAYRNHQRIGVAVADHPAGPWTRGTSPVLDVSPGEWDGLMTSNPTVCVTADGRILMMYKGVAEGPPPKGGAVNAGVAFADHPLGPFRKQPEVAVSNPTNDWAVEDPYVWCHGNEYYSLMKDFQGYFTKFERGSVALFESSDGIAWQPSRHVLAFDLQIPWAHRVAQSVLRLERPQLWFDESGMPAVLLCAVLEREGSRSYNIRIPLGRDE